MLTQIPSFTIKTVDTSDRGLGQASENVLINGQRIANKSGGAVDQLEYTRRQCRADRDRRRRQPWHRRSLGPGRERHSDRHEEGSGQFEYDANARSHYARPDFYGGNVSYSGRKARSTTRFRSRTPTVGEVWAAQSGSTTPTTILIRDA